MQIKHSPPASRYLDDEDFGISLADRTCSSAEELLTPQLVSRLHTAVPPRWRLVSVWRLVYSTTSHGFSLATLYQQSRHCTGPQIMAIRDDGDALFGVFATEPLRPYHGPYGTGECFLWRVDAGGRVKKYGSMGRNTSFLMGEASFVAAGCSGGQFGLWLDEQLLHGTSRTVATYDNEMLSSNEEFDCVSLELWGLDTLQ